VQSHICTVRLPVSAKLQETTARETRSKSVPYLCGFFDRSFGRRRDKLALEGWSCLTMMGSRQCTGWGIYEGGSVGE